MELVPKPKVIIQIMGAAPDGRPPPKPTYLVSCDIDAHEGRGHLIMTQNKAEAMRFNDSAEAFEYYRRQSTTHPLRDDGQPNRPLTAYHVMIQSEDQEPL